MDTCIEVWYNNAGCDFGQILILCTSAPCHMQSVGVVMESSARLQSRVQLGCKVDRAKALDAQACASRPIHVAHMGLVVPAGKGCPARASS